MEVVRGQVTASDLGVREPPAVAVPVLDHPVVDPPSSLEVAGEAAPRSGWRTRGAQQGAVQQGEVVAEADHSPPGGPLDPKGARVQADYVVQDRFGADGLHMRHALGRQRQAPDLRGDVVDEQSSHDRAERSGTGRQAGHKLAVAS